ncbi:hypothetical protein BC834DRAFT_837424, partial [Gloeopeniophorella convolvens]
DDIRVEYHPNSNRLPLVQPFEEYIRDKHERSSRPPPKPESSEPWRPFFNSREDFLFAEVLLDANLTRQQSEHLIKIVNTCLHGGGKFTLSGYGDLETAWKRAAHKLTPFEAENISAKHRDKIHTYTVHHRPLWDWITDLVFRDNGAPTSGTRIFDEPWTGDMFWGFQSSIPKGGTPLCLILYADKTKLSSFGTQKGYPVIARIANLPAKIRNGEGFGGGRVVGWLPIVKSVPEHRKAEYANFKCVVWHESFYILLEILAGHAEKGCWLQCGDEIARQFFPGILILSADYEEQCVMSLIRGVRGKRPCPICLIKDKDLADLTLKPNLRTVELSTKTVDAARAAPTKTEAERILSKAGLRDVENVFWRIPRCDPHRALSFDRLHSNNSGLFGHHLWGAFKAYVNDSLGSSVANKLDDQFMKVPSWRGLNHFSKVFKMTFTDGTKFEDVSKVLVFAAHNLIDRKDAEGWTLLRAIRAFSIVDLYLSFEVQINDTMAEGYEEFLKFSRLMEEYSELTENASQKEEDKAKNWAFPKMHALTHSFDDIRAKGVSRNYNTKPNEKMHGPLKKAYLFRTNFKDVAPQILAIEHYSLVSLVIRADIDSVDLNAQLQLDEDDIGSSLDSLRDASPRARGKRKQFEAINITMRSQRPEVTFEELQNNSTARPELKDFRVNLSKWLTKAIRDYSIDVGEGCLPVNFQPSDKITVYESIKVIFQSKVDWNQYIDLVYCNPSFHNKPRYDFVIVQTVGNCIFAQLLFLFTCSVFGQTFAVCLVRPLDAKPPANLPKDDDLGFHRVCARSRPEFIFARSIVRGAPLVPVYGDRTGKQHFVMDIVDHMGDLWLRCKEIFGAPSQWYASLSDESSLWSLAHIIIDLIACPSFRFLSQVIAWNADSLSSTLVPCLAAPSANGAPS